MDDWQRDVLDAALGERDGDGLWASYEVGLCCPRQNGKSAVLEALMLWSLFCDEPGLTIYSAHLFSTTREVFWRLDSLIMSDEELRPQVKRRATTAVEMGYRLYRGSRLNFLARSGGSGRGFSGDRVIFDEAMILSSESMLAMQPTLSAMPNPQLWFAGSAGFATSDHWRSVRDRGRAGDAGRLTWLEWAADLDAEATDRSAWAAANPAYPFRLTEDVIASELASMSANPETLAGWMRERLGWWDEPESEGQIIPADVWAAHAEPSARITGLPVFALDVSPLRTWSAIAVAGDTDGRPMVEIPAEANDLVDHRPGTSWVVPRLVDLTKRYGGNTVYLTGTASEALRPELEHEGLTVEALTAPQLAAACGVFFDTATASAGRGLVHAGQPELAGALAVARRAETDHGWQWGRRKSAGDITPLVAATVALWAHSTASPQPFFASKR